MKKYHKKISLLLSIFILLFYIFQYSLVAYASDDITYGGGGASGRPEPAEYEIYIDKYGNEHRLFTSDSGYKFYTDDNGHKHLVMTGNQLKFAGVEILGYLSSSLGAITNYDFVTFLSNTEAFEEKFSPDNIVISDDNSTESIAFSEDLVSYIKQALQEYSEETNGFWLVPTTSMRALPVQYFQVRESYISIQNLINKYGIIALQMGSSGFNPSIINDKLQYGYGSFVAADFSPYLDPNYSFVNANGTSYDPSTATQALAVGIYDAGWNKIKIYDRYSFSFNDNKIYSDIEEGNNLNETVGLFPFESTYVNYPKYNNGFLCFATQNRYTSGASMLISKDGCRLRVFKSETAMKMYDTGQRTVYFTESFYNDDAKAIHVAVDDLENFMNVKYDQYFDDLRKLIAESGGNLSEAEIEKLTAQVLGKLDHNNNLLEEGNQISSFWLERIYKELAAIDEMIAAKLDSIIEYLKKIKNWTIADTIVDGVDAVSDIISLITGILDDVDNGVGTAVATVASAFGDGAELMSKKFPFSVPWDLLFFVTLLASEPEVPHFEIPIDFDVSSLDIAVHYDFIVDFTEFQYLSDIFRTVLSMTYCVGLIKMTSGIVSIKKEE